ncbi:MAG: RNA replicase beta chain [Sanya fiers-like virus 15]|nr:MAG: RNA replicase beta chain [Sanya fiers-like virus 15]UUW21275.1 MAG: RNA replicase beta chain [Sanya fiers-like virus 15]UUW21278.1 MAG: RNA replicase beta chain [Sanya fiers-like virus 15]UUW21281.1 MAG: RNA replicase beta chain [Sanya fiers-like virus 15]UUW21284.1 MAG: RNA replicase beta chain [Sanya fiers-like virus 15]
MRIVRDIQRLLECLNTPVALGISLRLKYKEFDIPYINPNDYLTPDTYWKDAQAVAYVSKGFVLPIQDTEAAARTAFLSSEEQCKETNDRFRRLAFSFRDRSLLELARTYCHLILKDSPRDLKPDFGPGSTLFLKREKTNIISKLFTKPEVTPEAYSDVVFKILHLTPHYAISSGMVIRDRTSVKLGTQLATVVKGSKWSSVPKNAKTNRPICIEPSGNMFIQKAYGSAIRNQLERFGYKLDTAPELHGELARIGSIDGSYATIDLSAASDTVAYELVKFILPIDWFNSLNTVRCRFTEFDGRYLRLEKFSSMGNGYTFELESLIFLCLGLACRSHLKMTNTRISTFGDDIICHPRVGELLIELLGTAGFTTNKEKTFLTGSFRESCGQDFFNGVNVRPVYLKEKKYETVQQLYGLANRVRRIANYSLGGYGCDSVYLPIWKDIVRRIPAALRTYGHSHWGDSVLLSERWCMVRGKQKVLTHCTRRTRPDGHAYSSTRQGDLILACALKGIPSCGVIPRGYDGKPRMQWLRSCSLGYEHGIQWI